MFWRIPVRSGRHTAQRVAVHLNLVQQTLTARSTETRKPLIQNWLRRTRADWWWCGS